MLSWGIERDQKLELNKTKLEAKLSKAWSLPKETLRIVFLDISSVAE